MTFIYLIYSAMFFGLIVGILQEDAKLRYLPLIAIASLLWPIVLGYWIYRH